MQWLKQSTAATVLLGPAVDDTDGKTAETALEIAQADIRLSKNGGDIAQTHNAAGATHDELGYYPVPLDTTDTNTLGRLDVAISKTGALPMFASFMVVPAEAYDALVAGTDMLSADVVNWKGSAAPNNTGDAYARLGAPAGATTAADIAAIQSDTNDIQTRIPSTLVGGKMDSHINDVAAGAVTSIQTGLALDSTVAKDATVAKDSTVAKASALTTVEGKIDTIDTNVDSILADTGTDGVVVASASKTGYALTSAYDAAKTAASTTEVNNAADGVIASLPSEPPTTAEIKTALEATPGSLASILTAIGALPASEPPTLLEITGVVNQAADGVIESLPSEPPTVLEIQAGIERAAGILYLLNQYVRAAPAAPTASEIKTAMEAAGSYLALIKAVTDQMVFTIANKIDATANVSVDAETLAPIIEAAIESVMGSIVSDVESIDSKLTAGVSPTVVSNSVTDGTKFTAIIYRGGDANTTPAPSRAIEVTLTGSAWIDLTGLTVVCRIRDGATINEYDASTSNVGGADQKIICTLTTAESNALVSSNLYSQMIAKAAGTQGEDILICEGNVVVRELLVATA